MICHQKSLQKTNIFLQSNSTTKCYKRTMFGGVSVIALIYPIIVFVNGEENGQSSARIINYQPLTIDYTDIPKENISILALKKNLNRGNEIQFPVDFNVAGGIDVCITPTEGTTGFLLSPLDYKISFANEKPSTIIKYSEGSFLENRGGIITIHLNFSTSHRLAIGIWNLYVENRKFDYNVSIFAFTAFNEQNRVNILGEETDKYMLKLGFNAINISHITNISLLNTIDGSLITNDLSNSHMDYVAKPDAKTEAVNIGISNKLNRTKSSYALIRGEDTKGNAFQRLSFIYGNRDMYPLQTITIQVGLASELVLESGKRGEVYFEVTNYGTDIQQLTFTCSDATYILQRLSIYRRFLEPLESTIVTLYLNTRYGTYRDEITFSASFGSQVVQKKVIVDVNSDLIDHTPPAIYYKLTSDCPGHLFSHCQSNDWSIEITAEDQESGLLQLNTIPKGIFFPRTYTSGTRDSVTGHFSATCCHPDLEISAVDRLNNRNSININAYHANLSAGIIAGIVLGVIILVVMIVLIISFAVIKIRSKESYDLPTYRGGGI